MSKMKVFFAGTIFVFLVFSFSFNSYISFAQEDLSGEFAILNNRTGTVSVSHDGGTHWQPATIGDFFAEGDWLRTDIGAEAVVVFDPDGLNTVTMEGESTLRISQLQELSSSLDLSDGAVSSLLSGLRPGELFQIRTPSAIISAQGTEFIVAYDATTQQTQVEVLEGEVEIIPANEGNEAPETETQHVTAPTATTTDPAIYVFTPFIAGTTFMGTENFALMTGVTASHLAGFRSSIAQVRVEIESWKAQIAVLKAQDPRPDDEIRNIRRNQIEPRKKWAKDMTQRLKKLRRGHESDSDFFDRAWTPEDEGD